MKKILVGLLVLGLLVVAAVPALAANGRNTHEGSMGLGQNTTRAYIGELLLLDADALREARQEGMSMISIAESKGFTAESFISAIVEFRKAQLDTLVAEGKISSEQAVECEERMTERIQSNLERVPEPQKRMVENRQLQKGRNR